MQTAHDATDRKPSHPVYGEDEVLLARFEKGDQEAFDTLVRRYMGFAYAAARAYTGDSEAAKDVVATSLAKAYRASTHFRGQSRFGTWLYRIVVNCAKDYAGRNKSKQVASLEEMLNHDPTLEYELKEVPAKSSNSMEITPEFREELTRAIADLKPNERELLLLFHRDDASYQRIGVILGIPIGTVRSRLHRVREHLKAQLKRTHAS